MVEWVVLVTKQTKDRRDDTKIYPAPEAIVNPILGDNFIMDGKLYLITGIFNGVPECLLLPWQDKG